MKRRIFSRQHLSIVFMYIFSNFSQLNPMTKVTLLLLINFCCYIWWNKILSGYFKWSEWHRCWTNSTASFYCPHSIWFWYVINFCSLSETYFVSSSRKFWKPWLLFEATGNSFYALSFTENWWWCNNLCMTSYIPQQCSCYFCTYWISSVSYRNSSKLVYAWNIDKNPSYYWWSNLIVSFDSKHSLAFSTTELNLPKNLALNIFLSCLGKTKWFQ